MKGKGKGEDAKAKSLRVVSGAGEAKGNSNGSIAGEKGNGKSGRVFGTIAPEKTASGPLKYSTPAGKATVVPKGFQSAVPKTSATPVKPRPSPQPVKSTAAGGEPKGKGKGHVKGAKGTPPTARDQRALGQTEKERPVLTTKYGRACRCGNTRSAEYWQALETQETYCAPCWDKIQARAPTLGLVLGLEAMRDLGVALAQAV
eukprot:GEMP01081164.1.p2 GENE.GEMP01081164.1~~GEMP01081164.1.p2  ORF type:complete len:202 (+),score=54.22 GEMP01081164.1:1-606(+)